MTNLSLKCCAHNSTCMYLNSPDPICTHYTYFFLSRAASKMHPYSVPGIHMHSTWAKNFRVRQILHAKCNIISRNSAVTWGKGKHIQAWTTALVAFITAPPSAGREQSRRAAITSTACLVLACWSGILHSWFHTSFKFPLVLNLLLNVNIWFAALGSEIRMFTFMAGVQRLRKAPPSTQARCYWSVQWRSGRGQHGPCVTLGWPTLSAAHQNTIAMCTIKLWSLSCYRK